MEQSRREFLEYAACTSLTLLVSGCATNMPEGMTSAEYRELKREYYSINPKKLSSEQRVFLNEFNESLNESKEFNGIGLTDKDKNDIQDWFPWINPDNLSDRDKVFLRKMSEELFNAFYWND